MNNSTASTETKLKISATKKNNPTSKMEDFHQKFCADAPQYLKESMKRSKLTPKELEQHQNIRLQYMLQYAKDHSPFYTNVLRDVNISDITIHDLSLLPVLNKEIVMKHWDDIVTDRRLTYAGATEHLASLLKGEVQNPVLFDEYFVFATGGSSGKRGMFVWDKEMILTIIGGYYCEEALYDSTHPQEPGRSKRTACIHAGEWVHSSRVVFSTDMNDERERRVFTASMSLDELCKELELYQPDRINGYSSVLVELANMTINGKLNILPQMIGTYGEPLEPSGREAIKKAWNIKTINNAYGSTDVGLISYEGFNDDEGTMTVTEDLTSIEYVDEYNQPVHNNVNEPNVKCLMTKLYGKGMPLFRYETTDKIIMCNDGARSSVDGRRRIKRIEGRTDVWFTYHVKNQNDNTPSPNNEVVDKNVKDEGLEKVQDCTDVVEVKVHPIVFRHILGQIDDIIEYQVQQTNQGANVLLIAKDHRSIIDSTLCNKVQSLLIIELIKVGIQNAHVTVSIVNDLPRHSETNKLRRFVPL